MNRKIIITTGAVLLLISFSMGIFTTVFARPGEIRPLQQSSLPQITFLGQGPQTFTVEPPLKFLVKTYQQGQFLFVSDDGPTYDARRGERVWTIDVGPAEPIRLFDEAKTYGNVEAGCVVNYVQIEDNDDTRRNTFFINGEVLQVVEQGMVTYGSFTVPEAGELTFYAEDSIGMVVELCPNLQTDVPSESPTVTSTSETALPTETGTAEAPTSTSTPTQPASVQTSTFTLEPTELIIELSLTPTEPATSTDTPISPTQTPTGTSATATVSAPTASPRPSATAQVIMITATPISTPAVLPLTGGGPGPGEIAAVSLALISLSGLVAAGWWLLLRAYGKGQ